MSSSPKQSKSIYLFILAAILATAFIFRNSLQNGSVSNAWSLGISEWLRKLLDPNTRINPSTFHAAVRKAAHCIEFCFLGLSLTGIMTTLKAQTGKLHFFMVLFLALLVGVSDEFIQSFTGRTSCVHDILIDFAGASFGVIIGISCTLCCRFTIHRHRVSSDTHPISENKSRQ